MTQNHTVFLDVDHFWDQNAPHTNLCAHTHCYVEFYVHIKISKITILCGHIQILCGILCGQKARKQMLFQ